MRIAVTGAGGFIGKNLGVMVAERGWTTIPLGRDATDADYDAALAQADAVIHLAATNRAPDADAFANNPDATQRLCDAIRRAHRVMPVAISSSTHATLDTPYGHSKRAAELVVENFARDSGSPVGIFRLPNVCGKWSLPNYNSAIATFCHNVARDIPITVFDPDAPMTVVHVDDVVPALLDYCAAPGDGVTWPSVTPVYETTVGTVAEQIKAFRHVRHDLITEPVGTGLTRVLYATYVSMLPPEQFSYPLPKYGDERGVFVEMLKTRDSGQFSYFTAHPGVTRGGHYHHSKTEKFLVIKGRALYKFRHLITGETFTIESTGADPLVVETIPGWAHDITNIGDEELVVMLWANENFDRARPDTIAAPLF